MKKIFSLLAAFTLSYFCITTHAVGQDHDLIRQGNLRVLTLRGTPYERGLIHGTALREDIQDLVRLWKDDIGRSYKTDADEFIKQLLVQTNFQKAIQKWTPELWDELKGISEGSGTDFETMFAFQLVDEIWVLGRDIRMGKCTTIGVKKTANNPAIVAQNLDIPAFYHGFQTLLRIEDPKRSVDTFLFTFPGFIAANGINSHSVAVVVNAVQQLENSRDGLPVAFVIRGILQKKTYDEAVKFISDIKFGAPQNYMIGGREDVGSFECSASAISPYVPFAGAQFTYHTNHPLENLNYSPRFLKYLESKNILPTEYEHPCPRFRALQSILKDNSVKVDGNLLKEIFSNRETIINNDGTFGCTIMVLGKNPELHISPGRPDEEPFQIFRFDKQ